jgi:hypothetical protein
MKKLRNRKYCFLLCVVAFWLFCSNSIVNGLIVISDLGDVMMLSPGIIRSNASGQGTHSSFHDPELGYNDPIPSVAGGGDTINRWVHAKWNYYAHGFEAEYPNDGNVFCGVFASAEVSHSQSAWDGQKSGYVYDGVSAGALQSFDIAIGPLDEDAPEVENIPFTIKVNTFMDIGGSSPNDMGRAKAYFSFVEKKLTGGSTQILFVEVELAAETEFGRQFFNVYDNPIGLSDWRSGNDDSYSIFVFEDIKLKLATIYQATLWINTGAYSSFTFEDDSSQSWASGWMDPSFSFSSDFQYKDDFAMYISPGVIIEDGVEDSELELRMEQGNKQINEVAKDEGLVTVTALSEGFSADGSPKYVWSAMHPDINDVDGDYFDSTFVFDPSNLTSGSQTINVLLASKQDSLSESLRFEIISDDNTEIDNLPLEVYFVIALLATIIAALVIGFVVRKKERV